MVTIYKKGYLCDAMREKRMEKYEIQRSLMQLKSLLK